MGEKNLTRGKVETSWVTSGHYQVFRKFAVYPNSSLTSHPPSLPRLAHMSISSAASQQNKHHDDTCCAVLQESPIGTFSAESQFEERKCAHTPSRVTEGRQSRMWIACGWLRSGVSSKACHEYSGRVKRKTTLQNCRGFRNFLRTCFDTL